MKKLRPIGYVCSQFREYADPYEIRKQTCTIRIKPEYSEGLYRIGELGFLDVVFYLHKSRGFELKQRIINGEIKGVFTSRSPFRPNPIGVTRVRLLEKKGNELVVQGLDAIDQTPVLDIKTIDTTFNGGEPEEVRESKLLECPRLEIMRWMREGDLRKILLHAGMFHGHYCPGLSIGVMASSLALRRMISMHADIHDLQAGVNMHNCIADGIQFTTGCTLGKKNLVIGNGNGPMNFYLSDREGNGIRVREKPGMKKFLEAKDPAFRTAPSPEEETEHNKHLRDVAFEMLGYNTGKMFSVETS